MAEGAGGVIIQVIRNELGQIMGTKPRPILDRFWEKVDIRGPDDCWEWLVSKDLKGYGRLWYKNGSERSHRVAWELTFGSIPNKICVCHHCDNPGCCNPTHLFLGTNSDNNKDRFKKGGYDMSCIKGEKNHSSKLTEHDVRNIRFLTTTGISNNKMSRFYPVSRRTIDKIVNRETWRHIK